KRGPRLRGRSVERLDHLGEALAIGHVAGHDQLGQHDKLCAALECETRRGQRQLSVLAGGVRLPGDLGERDGQQPLHDSEGSAPAAFSIATSAGHGPPTLTTGLPRSAFTRCWMPGGTWIAWPASNSRAKPWVRSSTVPRP